MCLRPLAIKMEGKPCNVVPCGKCNQCLRARQNSWAFRLNQERKVSTSSIFITLTYDNDNIKLYQGGYKEEQTPTLVKRDLQNFIKRLRKRLIHTKIKYYACGEYGNNNNRPHYHAIIYNLPKNFLQDINILTNIWGKGHVCIAPCNDSTIRYTTKYMLKGKDPDYNDNRNPEFSIMSQGLGKSYLTKQMKNYHRENLIGQVTLPGGILTTMPRYYKDKIFDDDMKAQLTEEAEAFRNYNFEKFFNSDIVKKYTWKVDQRRKVAKKQKMETDNLISDVTMTQITKVLLQEK